MIYFFDTNVVLAFARQKKLADAVSEILNLTDDNEIYISVVNAGEIWSIVEQNSWGATKRAKLKELLNSYVRIAITDDDLIEAYAQIDAFSQNKLIHQPLGTSARNMGKNDLWIAASASLLGATLITTDRDFDHLHGQFLDIICLDPEQFK